MDWLSNMGSLHEAYISSNVSYWKRTRNEIQTVKGNYLRLAVAFKRKYYKFLT